MEQLDEYHCAELLSEGTYRIDEKGMVNAYLLCGRQKALLIDAGCGAGNLKACVQKLTDLPVTLAVTHRHPDHVGGAWEFGSYYAGEQDCRLLYDFMCQPFFSAKMVQAAGGTIAQRKPLGSRITILPMKEDQQFDLGGREIIVRSVPGHTRGSMIFLDAQRKQMFTGDDINPFLWMHLPGCTSLQEWQNGAQKIQQIAAQGYTSYYGHGDGRQPIAQMQQTWQLVQEIITKKQEHQLPSGKQIYPAKDIFPCVYYNSRNILQRV